MSKHKDKFTGILDKNGVKINNGDNVLVYHYNSYPKHPYNCKVIYKRGWKLISTDGTNNGKDYCVESWRKSIEVVGSGESVFITNSYEEIKDKWFQKNVSFLITGEQRKLLHKCFEEAFKLGQEQLYNSLNP